MGRRISTKPLLQFSKRTRADEVKLERREAQLRHMAVRVDQPGQKSSASAIDDLALRSDIVGGAEHPDHLAVITDQQAREMLQFAVGADLQSVDVGNQCVRGGW